MVSESKRRCTNFGLLLSFLIVCSVLLGCSDKPCTDNPNSSSPGYDNCLFRYESVESTRQFGPFTVLRIRYTEPFGHWGADFAYERVLYKGRILMKKVDFVRPWLGLPETVLFVEFYEGDASSLHLTFERDGQPIIERIDAGNDGWVGTDHFPNGFPLHRDIRYFPRSIGAKDAGFLLGVLPTRVTTLPLGPQGVRVPWIQQLVGIAPDGKSYAYTDSNETPTAVVVVDDNGLVHDPIPIPFTSLLLNQRPGENTFGSVRHWFSNTFIWKKSAAGYWEIMPKWRPSSDQNTNPVEEVFIDAANGYKACFASVNSACVPGWEAVKDDPQSSDCCLSPYIYRPSNPTRVFGRKLLKLVYSKSLTSDSGYHVQLDASREAVAAALTERLKIRNIPFVRVDKCSNIASDEEECMAQLRKTVNWRDSPDHYVIDAIFRSAHVGAVVVTPTVALAIYSDSNNKTWINTLTRYDLRR